MDKWTLYADKASPQEVYEMLEANLEHH